MIPLHCKFWPFLLLLSLSLSWQVGFCQETAELVPEDKVISTPFATGVIGNPGIIFDSAGTLYTTNYRREATVGRISLKFKAEILLDLQQKQEGNAEQVELGRLAIDREGRLLLTDVARGKLIRINPEDGTLVTIAERSNGRQFSSLYGVAIDRTGNLYMSEPLEAKPDTQGGTVYKFDIATQKTSPLITKLDSPTGLAISAEGDHLCIAEAGTGRVQIHNLKTKTSDSEDVNTLIRELDIRELLGLASTTASPRISDMVYDQKKQLYICLWDTCQILVVDTATGKRIRLYKLDGENVSSCALHQGSLYVAIPDKEAIFRLKINAPNAIGSTP